MKKDFRFYLKLFYTTFSVSAFTFGGGYVIIPLMKKKLVEELHWIEEDEMLDIVAISQMLPGPMVVDAFVLVGYRLAGIPGAILTLLSTLLPPFAILSIVTLFYQAFKENPIVSAVLRGMQGGIAAVISDVVISGGAKIVKSKDALSIIIMAASFCAVYFLKLNVVVVILACGALGGFVTYFRNRGRAGV